VTIPLTTTDALGFVIVAGDQLAALGGAAEHWLEELGCPGATMGHPPPLPLLALVRRLELLERTAVAGRRRHCG
jgi:hypothetical protein